MEAKAQKSDYFGQEDKQFQLLLYRNIGNEVLNELLELFWAIYDQLAIDALDHSQRLDETAAHHCRILTALKDGDIGEHSIIRGPFLRQSMR